MNQRENTLIRAQALCNMAYNNLIVVKKVHDEVDRLLLETDILRKQLHAYSLGFNIIRYIKTSNKLDRLIIQIKALLETSKRLQTENDEYISRSKQLTEEVEIDNRRNDF